MELYLVRHSRVANMQGRCYGQRDVALANSFENEREKIKAQLPARFDVIYSSPLSRCMRLAEYLCVESTPIICDERLLEMHFGQWEGKAWQTIEPHLLDAWGHDFVSIAPPEGENLRSLAQRVNAFIDMLRQQQHQRVLICAHAGVLRCVVAKLLGMPLANIFNLHIDYGQCIRIKLGEAPCFDQLYFHLSD